MSDIKVAEAAIVRKVNWFVRGWEAFWKGVWIVIKGVGLVIYHVARQLWSIVSDKDWDFDPWKLSGFGAFGVATWIALRVVDLSGKPTVDPVVIGTLAGLVTAFITVGTFLFGQSRQNDKGQ